MRRSGKKRGGFGLFARKKWSGIHCVDDPSSSETTRHDRQRARDASRMNCGSGEIWPANRYKRGGKGYNRAAQSRVGRSDGGGAWGTRHVGNLRCRRRPPI